MAGRRTFTDMTTRALSDLVLPLAMAGAAGMVGTVAVMRRMTCPPHPRFS
jgi:hypothetical protein